MVGHVGDEVRVVTVLLLHHAVFVVLEVRKGGIRRSEPKRSVGFIGVAGLFDRFNGAFDPAVGVKRAFEVEVVESNAQSLQVAVLFVAQIRHRIAADALIVVGVAGRRHYVARGRRDRLLGNPVAGDVHDVVAVVAVFREVGVRRLPFQLQGAGLHALRKVFNLHARVVVVELAHHAVALRRHDAGQHVAQGALARVAQMKGPRGVGGHVFEENALTRHGVRGTEGSALCQNVAHDAQRRFFVEGEIDEARARDFHGGKQSRKPRIRLHGVHDHLRYVARVLLENFGALQRCGAREVAVLRVLRAIQARRHAFDADGFKGVTQEGGEGCFLFFNHFFLLTRVVERGPAAAFWGEDRHLRMSRRR